MGQFGKGSGPPILLAYCLADPAITAPAANLRSDSLSLVVGFGYGKLRAWLGSLARHRNYHSMQA